MLDSGRPATNAMRSGSKGGNPFIRPCINSCSPAHQSLLCLSRRNRYEISRLEVAEGAHDKVSHSAYLLQLHAANHCFGIAVKASLTSPGRHEARPARLT